MKENIGDNVYEGISERMTNVLGAMRDQYRNTKPFRKEFITTGELITEYDSMTPERWAYMEAKLGRQGTAEFIMRMEALKRQKYG